MKEESRNMKTEEKTKNLSFLIFSSSFFSPLRPLRSWRFIFFLSFGLTSWLLAACGSGTPTPAVPTLVSAAGFPTATFTPSPTATVTPTYTPSATPTSVVNFAPTDVPLATYTPLPTVLPVLTPGVPVRRALPAGQADLFYVDTIEDQPIFVVAVGSKELDPAVVFYNGDILAMAGAQGQSVAQALPSLPTSKFVNNSQTGLPEITIYTTQKDSRQTLGVGGMNGTAGGYELFVLDTLTKTADTPVMETNTVIAGQPKQYLVRSADDRPVVAFVAPQNNANVGLAIKYADGSTIVTSDYGWGGVAEAAFVRPGSTTDYIIEVSTKHNFAVTFIVVVLVIQRDVD